MFTYCMFIMTTIILLFSGCTQKKLYKPHNAHAKTSFYDLQATSIDGRIITMSEYKNKNIMIVNTASQCWYTNQYQALEDLYQKHKDSLVILGFPSHEFMGQEPKSNTEIKQFCKVKYGVTFPLFAKTNTQSKDQSPIYQWLTDSEKNGWNTQAPTWNFCKYIINPQGELVAFFDQKVAPESPMIKNIIK